MIELSDVLKNNLSSCILSKSSNPKSSSIAVSYSGKYYPGVKIESLSHLLDVSSEACSLLRSVQNNDFNIKKIITLSESDIIDPLILKVLADYSIKTGNVIEYIIYNFDNDEIFRTENVLHKLDFYEPNIFKLKKTDNSNLESNVIELDNIDAKELPSILRTYSIKGILKNFPNYDSASGYGSAVLTKNNKIYFSGQYSSPDNRLGIHAEMSAVISAIMSNDSEITSIGIVSTKFKDVPCAICGSCRQFLAEHSSRTKTPITIFSFAKDNPLYKSYSLSDYLPNSFIL